MFTIRFAFSPYGPGVVGASEDSDCGEPKSTNAQKIFKDWIKETGPRFRKFGCSLFVAGFVAIEVSAAEVEHPVLNTPTGRLAATLTMPPHTAKVPMALIVATDRDGNTPFVEGRSDSLRLLAEALAEAGIASLRYDKRRIGESASVGLRESDLRFEMYVHDAASGYVISLGIHDFLAW